MSPVIGYLFAYRFSSSENNALICADSACALAVFVVVLGADLLRYSGSDTGATPNGTARCSIARAKGASGLSRSLGH